MFGMRPQCGMFGMRPRCPPMWGMKPCGMFGMKPPCDPYERRARCFRKKFGFPPMPPQCREGFMCPPRECGFPRRPMTPPCMGMFGRRGFGCGPDFRRPPMFGFGGMRPPCGMMGGRRGFGGPWKFMNPFW